MSQFSCFAIPKNLYLLILCLVISFLKLHLATLEYSELHSVYDIHALGQV